jgi:hypothetical protein
MLANTQVYLHEPLKAMRHIAANPAGACYNNATITTFQEHQPQDCHKPT